MKNLLEIVGILREEVGAENPKVLMITKNKSTLMMDYRFLPAAIRRFRLKAVSIAAILMIRTELNRVLAG